MAEKEFAFESGKVSVAFNAAPALGDTIIAKSVFDALCRLIPDCRIDVYCTSEASKSYVKAFYGGSKNLNAIVSFELYAGNIQRYDAAFRVWHMVLIDFANVQRLQNAAPALLKALEGIDSYNKNTFTIQMKSASFFATWSDLEFWVLIATPVCLVTVLCRFTIITLKFFLQTKERTHSENLS